MTIQHRTGGTAARQRLKVVSLATSLFLVLLGLAGLRTADPVHASTGPVVAKSDGWDQECALTPNQNDYIFVHYASIFWFGLYLKAENAGAWTTNVCPDQRTNAGVTDITSDANDGIGLGLIYAGRQDPCIANPSKYVVFSTNTSTAKTQGEDDADTAWPEAEALGFPANVYIYFDLEGFSNTSSCDSAAQAFIAGWDSEMELLGGHPGVYGSTCSSDIANFRNVSPVPQAIWPAWYSDPSHTSVYGLSAACSGSQSISNSWWNENQRIVQWTSGKGLSTTGNGNNDSPVDFDCADGPVMDIANGSGVTLGTGCKGDQ